MTRVTILKPPATIKATTPQCSVVLNPGADWTKRNDYVRYRREKCERGDLDPKRCVLSSSFKIDGKDYCTRHAGQAALKILMGEP